MACGVSLYEHSWTIARNGDVFCVACSERPIFRDDRRTVLRLLGVTTPGPATPPPRVERDGKRSERRKPRKPDKPSIDRLVSAIEKQSGEPPTMWYEDDEWVVEVLDPERHSFVRFAAPKLSEALTRASWAKLDARQLKAPCES